MLYFLLELFHLVKWDQFWNPTNFYASINQITSFLKTILFYQALSSDWIEIPVFSSKFPQMLSRIRNSGQVNNVWIRWYKETFLEQFQHFVGSQAKCLGKRNFLFSRVLSIDSASKECYPPLRFNILYF